MGTNGTDGVDGSANYMNQYHIWCYQKSQFHGGLGYLHAGKVKTNRNNGRW